MRVDLYQVNYDDSLTLDSKDVDLAECFPDDPEEFQRVLMELYADPVAYYGGGAAPLFKFVRVG